MPWQSVAFSGLDVPMKLSRLQSDFAEVHTLAGAPRKAKMYCSQGVEDSTTAYFSPEAVTLAQLLLKLHGAVDCVAPNIGNLNLLVANSGGQRSNL